MIIFKPGQKQLNGAINNSKLIKSLPLSLDFLMQRKMISEEKEFSCF